MDRAQVGRTTRQAQTVGIILLAAGAAIAVLPTGLFSEHADTPATLLPAPPGPEAPKAPPPVPFDLAMAMENSAPTDQPREQAPATDANDTTPGAEPTPPPPPPPTWRYVGSIIGPTLRRAVLAKEDQQKLVSEGETIGDWQIVSIAPHSLTILEHGTERQEPLAARAAKPDESLLGDAPKIPNFNPDPNNPTGIPPNQPRNRVPRGAIPQPQPGVPAPFNPANPNLPIRPGITIPKPGVKSPISARLDQKAIGVATRGLTGNPVASPILPQPHVTNEPSEDHR